MRYTVCAAALLVLTAWLFAPVVGYPLVYEDDRDAHLLLDGSYTSMLITAVPLRSLTVLSKALDRSLFGIQAWGFHLGSLIVHLVNVALVLTLAWLVLPPWGAVAAAGIFAWHPVQVEAVAYVSARGDLLSTGFLLLALLSATCGSMAGALVGVILASITKETAGVAWALVPLWASWSRAPFPVRRWLVVGAVGAALGVVAVLYWIGAVRFVFDSVLMGHQLAVIGSLLSLVVLPWGFAVDHDWAGLAWLGPAALILACGLTALAVLEGWPRRQWWAFGWLWTLAVLWPRLVVPLDEGLHEHHLYMVLVGWCLCAGHWLTSIDARKVGVCG